MEEKRRTTAKITMRFTPLERALIEEAVRRQPDAWRGLSHHLRRAILEWAMSAESRRRGDGAGHGAARAASVARPMHGSGRGSR